MKIGRGYDRSWIGRFSILTVSMIIRDLQCINFLRLSHKESVIVTPLISVHTLWIKGEIKQYQFSQESLTPWSLEAA